MSVVAGKPLCSKVRGVVHIVRVESKRKNADDADGPQPHESELAFKRATVQKAREE